MAGTDYELTGEIRLHTALHIGSGSGDERTDATIVRDARGTPYIPGSSLRGILRSAVEARAPERFSCRGLALQHGHCARPESLSLAETNFAQQQAELKKVGSVDDWITGLFQQKGMSEELKKGDPTVAQGIRALVAAPAADEYVLIELLSETLCPTCRLFGSLDWASPLHIPDLYAPVLLAGLPAPVANWLRDNTRYFLSSVDGQQGPIRHGVGIDRDTGAARDQIKYDFEVLPGGQSFLFALHLSVPADLSAEQEAAWLGLLALGLRLLEAGMLTLGGRVARGIGRMTLELTTVRAVSMSGVDLLDALIGASRAADGRLLLASTEQWDNGTTPDLDSWIKTHLTALREAGA